MAHAGGRQAFLPANRKFGESCPNVASEVRIEAVTRVVTPDRHRAGAGVEATSGGATLADAAESGSGAPPAPRRPRMDDWTIGPRGVALTEASSRGREKRPRPGVSKPRPTDGTRDVQQGTSARHAIPDALGSRPLRLPPNSR